MDIEIDGLDLRYEHLRRRDPRREKRLLASVAESGQQFPILVVQPVDGNIFVVVDGYKRVRALKKLGREMVLASRWEIAEVDAVMLEGLMRSAGGDGPLEQAWRLKELRDRFALTTSELARRFDKSASWVSRRLSLVSALPEAVQRYVRNGEIVAYGAMKFLAPLARANRADCVKIAAGIAKASATTRQMRELYAAYMEGNEEIRKRIVEQPELFLRAASEPASVPDVAPGAARVLFEDLGQLGGVARRVHRRLREGLARRVRPYERDDVSQCAKRAETDVTEAVKRLRKEFEDAERNDASDDSETP